MRYALLPLFLLVASPALGAGKPNTLTPAEKKAGWKLLFDGKTTNGWRVFGGDKFPEKGWEGKDGVLRRAPGPDKPGDIVTTEKFSNFELKLEWKLVAAGNSGLKYLIDESLVKPGSKSGLGFEYQIL